MSEDNHIFAQGRDAGVPHNHGTPDMPLRLGQTIVFDIFPKTASGYFHDMTRTWCLGYAPDEVISTWSQCKEIFDQTLSELAVGEPCRDFQAMTLDYFGARGHPTMRTHPGGHEGYVHSLGHGLGLDIHEEPRLECCRRQQHGAPARPCRQRRAGSLLSGARFWRTYRRQHRV